MGDCAFIFNSVYNSELTMRNLPTLTTLTAEGSHPFTFQYPQHIVLENMPNLASVTLPNEAFEGQEVVSFNNIGVLAGRFEGRVNHYGRSQRRQRCSIM